MRIYVNAIISLQSWYGAFIWKGFLTISVLTTLLLLPEHFPSGMFSKITYHKESIVKYAEKFLKVFLVINAKVGWQLWNI